jgi:hypothetical protein
MKKNDRDNISQTSLYDLIEAVSDEIKPGEDNLIPKTIQHLFDSGQAKFIDCSTEVCGSV